ncbi:MAG: nucleotide-binding protein [Methanomicrobiales archaeon]|nr:nucleotide-binding protein [Methanomicrobiales archaeon]
MKIRNINVKISPLAVIVVVIFTILLIFSYIVSKDTSILIWGIPTLILLLLIPIALNYMSQQSYAEVIPEYEREAKSVRIKAINPNMVGEIVRIQGVVERVYFRYLNRPQYLVADKTGEISVKIFTSPTEDIRVNDLVEVVGSVIKRYIATGDPVINCVSIKKIGKQAEEKKKE